MRLIDADALKKAIPNTHVDIFENCRNCRLLDDEQVKQLIDDAPTIELLKEQEAVKPLPQNSRPAISKRKIESEYFLRKPTCSILGLLFIISLAISWYFSLGISFGTNAVIFPEGFNIT